MDSIQFVDLHATTVTMLFLVGFVGGMVSGFIGSGGAFVLTPAMMSMGVPGIVAMAVPYSTGCCCGAPLSVFSTRPPRCAGGQGKLAIEPVV